MAHNRSTQAVHAGEERCKPFGALTTPIVLTSTYTFGDTAEILDYVECRDAGEANLRHEYGRYSNPTQTAAERKIAALEGGERALLFASGMNAITTTLLALLMHGDHLVMASGAYRRTHEFGEQYLPRWGIETTFVPIDDPDALEAAIRPSTRLIFGECPTNPYLRLMDLSHVARVGQDHGVLTAVDSTFATPINMRPLEFGLDLVLHSATKYLADHNDILAGAVIGSGEVLDRIREARGILGGVGSPLDAYLLVRGLKTLDLRLRRQNENGQRVAQYLEGHPRIRRVYYPGLASHPDHELAVRQMQAGDGQAAYGGVVSFEIDGDLEATGRFMDRLQLPYIGPTLGGVETIAQQQAIFISRDAVKRRKAGIADNLVRYALGIEDAEDLIADLDQALAGL